MTAELLTEYCDGVNNSYKQERADRRLFFKECVMAKKKQKSDNEITFLNGRDSRDEIHFEWYCQELKDAGILLDFVYHPESFHLLDGYYYSAIEERPRTKKEHS